MGFRILRIDLDRFIEGLGIEPSIFPFFGESLPLFIGRFGRFVVGGDERFIAGQC